MKSHWLGWVGVTLSLCGLAACGKGHVITAKQFGVPTFEGLPVITNQAQLPVHGKRTANTEVWATQGSTDGRLAPSADSTSWSGTLGLQQGLNTVFLYAVDAGSKSEKSTGYTVFLDTTPPTTPTVYAPDAVNVGAAGTTVTTISGTKDADSSIVINGNTLVPNDGLTAWTTTITVILGDNTYNITAVDAAGNVSAPVVLSIFGSTLSPPIILVPSGYASLPPNFNPNDKPFLTNNPNAEFIGTKDSGLTNLFFSMNGGPVQDVGFNNTVNWDYPFQLGADGTYLVGFSVKKNGSDQRSATQRVKIMLKTTRPQKPVISSPSFPVADTGDASITLVGSLPSADSQLCVSNTSGGPCIATSGSYTGGSFTVAVPLGNASTNNSNTGDNPLFISARDAYGNISDEISTTVYRIAPPVVVLTAPTTSGGVGTIMGSSLHVTLTVTPNTGDDSTAHPGAAIQRVHVCLETTCVDATSGGSGSYTVNPDFDLTGFLNGTIHKLTVTADNSLSTPVETKLVYSLYFTDGSPIWLSNGDGAQTALAPRSAFDSAGWLHVVWTDFCSASLGCTVADANQAQPPDIFYANRDPSSGAWSPPKLVSSLTGDGASQSATIAVDNADNVHIVWRDNGAITGKPTGTSSSGFTGIVHRIRSHTGTFSTATGVSAVAGVNDDEPTLAVDSTGAVHLAFTRKGTGTLSDIMYSRYVSGAWTAAVPVTNPNTVQAGLPSIAGGPAGTAHVAWQQCSGTACAGNPNYDIYLHQITNTTNPIQGFGPVVVSDGSGDGDSRQPSLVVDSNGISWVFWRDTATTGNRNGLGHNAPNNIWLQQYTKTGAKVQDSLSIISNDPSTGTDATNMNFSAEQPMASIGPVISGDQRIAVVWTQGNASTSSGDIASKAGHVSQGLAGLVNPAMRYVVQDTGASGDACLALDNTDGDDLYVVWDDTSSFGAANTAMAQQIFFQLQVP